MKPWVKLENLNKKAKGDVAFLRDNLLEDIKSKQTNAIRYR